MVVTSQAHGGHLEDSRSILLQCGGLDTCSPPVEQTGPRVTGFSLRISSPAARALLATRTLDTTIVSGIILIIIIIIILIVMA